MGNRKWLAEILAIPTALGHLRNGDLDAMYQVASQGADMAAHIGADEQECDGALMMGLASQLRGQYEVAITSLQRSRRAGAAAGLPFLEAEALCGLGMVHMDISDSLMDQIKEFHSRASVLMEAPLGAVMGGLGWGEIGFCALAAGDVESASALFEKGLEVSTAMKYLARPLLLVGSAFVAMGRDNPDEAGKLVDEARKFEEERGMRNWYPLVAYAEGQVSTARGDAEGALAAFGRGEEQALQMGMRPFIWQNRAAAASALEALGRPVEASAKRDAARAVIDEIADLFEDETLRGLYLESAAKKQA